jgi:glycosyltransferase involved in cell wall biosynthesis
VTYPVSVIVATWGDQWWRDLALDSAVPSAARVGALEVRAVHDPGGDSASVRNQAALDARGDWLAFLDADDELHPGYLEAMAPHMAPGRLLIPAVQYVHGSVRGPARIPNRGGWPDTNDACVGTLVERVRFIEAGGFYDEFWPWSDWELWLRLVGRGAVRMHVPDAVYVAYEREESENRRLPRRDAVALHARIKRLHQNVWEAA